MEGIMKTVALVALLFIKIAKCQEHCIVDIDCDHCFPDHLPFITSHTANQNLIKIAHGEQATFHCHKSKFKLFPEKDMITVMCDSGTYRTLDNLEVKHLSDLGCQTNYFEDVVHRIDNCNTTLQGRSYQYYDTINNTIQHLLETCHNPENGRILFTRMTLNNNNDIAHNKHDHRENQLSYLEMFGKISDDTHKIESEQLYSNDDIMNMKFKTLLGMDSFNFADQRLVTMKLLPAKYFHNQNGIVTKYPSNKIAAWGSVANGNIKHIQNDIYDTFYGNSKKNDSHNIDVYVGTYETLTLPIRNKEHKIYLKPSEKFPVPKYIYTIVHNKSINKAIALVVINNPFISISEIKNLVFCSSMCSSVSWLQNLKKNNNYERIGYGLVFCCDIHHFSHFATESPDIVGSVHVGEKGLLKNFV